MLVLKRKVGESVTIGGNITITVTRVGDGSVRLGFEAPAGVPIVRGELPQRSAQPNAESPAVTIQPTETTVEPTEMIDRTGQPSANPQQEQVQ